MSSLHVNFQSMDLLTEVSANTRRMTAGGVYDQGAEYNIPATLEHIRGAVNGYQQSINLGVALTGNPRSTMTRAYISHAVPNVSLVNHASPSIQEMEHQSRIAQAYEDDVKQQELSRENDLQMHQRMRDQEDTLSRAMQAEREEQDMEDEREEQEMEAKYYEEEMEDEYHEEQETEEYHESQKKAHH